jgi:hypothetical protein
MDPGERPRIWWHSVLVTATSIPGRPCAAVTAAEISGEMPLSRSVSASEAGRRMTRMRWPFGQLSLSPR